MLNRLALTGTKCITQAHGENYSLYHGDSVKVAKGIPDNSVGLIFTSEPFGNQYGYSDELADFGSTKDNEHYFEQMDYLIPDMLRVLIPGRLAVIHCKDRIIYGSKSKHHVVHIDRFSDKTADRMEKHGFLFAGRVTITTDVVAENSNTHRLTWKEMKKDGSRFGVGMNEYLMIFREKPTEGTRSDQPIWLEDGYNLSNHQLDSNGTWRSSGNRLLFPWETFEHTEGEAPISLYDYAAHVAHLEKHVRPRRGSGKSQLEPIPTNNPWEMANNVDYRRMNVLSNGRGIGVAERTQNHICPLQLDVIERGIRKYSNPGDVVWDCFNGIGSVTVVAIELGRYGLGSELKKEYFEISAGYCAAKEDELKVPTLFDMNGIG
jgi:DNA modification methylase